MTYWFKRAAKLRHRHYGDVLEAVLVGVLIVALFATYGTDAGVGVVLVAQYLIVVPQVMQRRHRKGPHCLECVREMPLNPAESAREPGRARRGLRAFHAMTGTLPRFWLGAVLTLTLWVLGAGPVYAMLGMDGAAERANVFLSLGLLYSVTLGWACRTHKRLEPWCPYCDDDGDEDDEEPAVDPVGGRGRPAPA